MEATEKGVTGEGRASLWRERQWPQASVLNTDAQGSAPQLWMKETGKKTKRQIFESIGRHHDHLEGLLKCRLGWPFFWEKGEAYFPYSSDQIQFKSPNISYVTNLRKLWRNSPTRTLRPKEGQCGEFPEFSFCLTLSQAWSRRNCQPGNADGLRPKKISTKGFRKRQPTKTETLWKQ